MNRWKIIVLAFSIALLSVVGYLAFSGKEEPKGQDVTQVVPKAKPKRGNGKVKRVNRIREKKLNGEKGGIPPNRSKVKPKFILDDDDEANLNAEQRKMIEAIRAALDENDRKKVLALVQKLQTSDEWPDGIPKSIKMAAIEALGWFGGSCLPEIAGFLADGDEEVVQSAIEKYEEALSDLDLSDRDRSLILIQASKVIDDADAMDSMLFELNNMRHSVAVKTLKVLMAEGNKATKQVLPEAIEFYTGEENINSPLKLDEWLKQNPDEEGDDEFYGGTDPNTSQSATSSQPSKDVSK